jgi:hypothetical protein
MRIFAYEPYANRPQADAVLGCAKSNSICTLSNRIFASSKMLKCLSKMAFEALKSLLFHRQLNTELLVKRGLAAILDLQGEQAVCRTRLILAKRPFQWFVGRPAAERPRPNFGTGFRRANLPVARAGTIGKLTSPNRHRVAPSRQITTQPDYRISMTAPLPSAAKRP